MRTPNTKLTTPFIARTVVSAVTALALLAACGSDGDSQAEVSVAEDSSTGDEVGPIGDTFVEQVRSVSTGLWTGADGIERIDLLVGTDDVDRFERELREDAELIDGLESSWPESAPAEYAASYDAYRSAVDAWRTAVDDALAVIDERGDELQNELNQMGDDIGQRMEASELSRLRNGVFDLREAASSSCFDMQAAAENEPPVIPCTNVIPTAETVGDRVNVDTTPPLTLTLADPEAPVIPFPNGLDIGGDDSFYITSKVEVAEPGQPYMEMGINPVDPPADFREWIDATPIVRVIEEGELTIDGIDSRWWRLNGDNEALIEATGGVDFAAVWRHAGRGGPYQIVDFERTAITVWEIPHPDGTIYAFTKFINDQLREQVFATMESIRFDG